MSSLEEKIALKRELIPVIDTDVFFGNEDKRFALVAFTPDSVLNYKQGSIEQAYLKLRANVYVNQKKFLENEVKRVDGTELDENDERSTHLVILENQMGRAAIFACMRLIEKTNINTELPVEEFFPDAFTNSEAPINSVEISRFIVRHDESIHATAAKKKLIAAAVARTFDGDLGPVYAVVEANLERDLRMMRVPTVRIAEPRLVPEYNTENLGIEIDKYGTRNRIGEEAVSAASVVRDGEFAFWGQIE